MVVRPFIAPQVDWAARLRTGGALTPSDKQNPHPSPLPAGEGIVARPSKFDPKIELPRGHVAALDAIRGLAILTVTLYRFGGGAGGGASAVGHSWVMELGAHGVDLFFVLSGFLITGILFNAKGKEHYFRDFYVRRALRIFPLYYAALLVTLLILPGVGGSLGAAFSASGDY